MTNTYTFTDLLPEHYRGRSKVIAEYFDKIQIRLDRYPNQLLEISNMKEKYGRLQIDCVTDNEAIDRMIYELEEKTENICVMCGKKGKLRDDLSRMLPLCETHYKAKLKSIEKLKKKSIAK